LILQEYTLEVEYSKIKSAQIAILQDEINQYKGIEAAYLDGTLLDKIKVIHAKIQK